MTRLDLNPSRSSSNPMIGYGPSGSWYEANIFDPYVLPDPTDATKLVMYTSGQATPVGSGVQSIGLWRATVAGFLTNPATCWTFDSIVLQGGASGTWDRGGVRLGSVVISNGTTYLFYTGGTATGNTGSSIGVATATDGKTFTKASANPILSPANDENQLGEPDVLFDGTTWTMIYDYRTSSLILPGYRYATATNPLTTSWTRGNGGADIFNLKAGYALQIECHRTILLNGTWTILFEAGGSTSSSIPYRILYALSTSGLPTGPYVLGGTLLPENSAAGSASPDYYHVATPFYVVIGGVEWLFYQGANQMFQPYYNNQWSLNVAKFIDRTQFLPTRMKP